MINAEKAQNSDQIVDIAEQHHKAGRLQEAENLYNNALKIDPGHPGALYYLANIAYGDGRLQFAIRLIEELLRGEPNDVEAWHLLGVMAFKKENSAHAIECFQKVLAIQPGYAQVHYNLGSVLNSVGDVDAALSNLHRAVVLNPTFAEAYCLIGNICQAQNRLEEALQNYQLAINAKSNFKLAYEYAGGILLSQEKWSAAIAIYQAAIAAGVESVLVQVGIGVAHLHINQHGDAAVYFEHAISLDACCFLAHFHLGDALFNQGKFLDAVVAYEKAKTLSPQDKRPLAKLIKLFNKLHEFEKAGEIYRQWLVLEPDNAVARHHIAGCTGEEVPTRANDAYIEHTFDKCAETFDVTLGQLRYRGPQLLAEALQRTCMDPCKQYTILDAGCGTGLCGPLIVEYAALLKGVDLSSGMLTKARSRNVYDELIKAELTAYLQSQLDDFDIILSADTFIYFGALEALLAAAHTALRNDGYLFFTVESSINHDEPAVGYRLYPHGRYSHSESYLRRTLHNAGFTIIAIESATIRYEGLNAVPGLVVSCRVAG